MTRYAAVTAFLLFMSAFLMLALGGCALPRGGADFSGLFDRQSTWSF